MGGRPKGLAVVGTSRIVDRVADALHHACSSVILAANDDGAADWLPDIGIVRDRYAGAGGLAGVDAAIAHAGDVAVVAWDMPFVPGALLEELVRRARDTAADVVLPESDSPHGVEPFCAFYSARVLQPLGIFLATGGGPAHEFLVQLDGVHRMPLRDVSAFGDPATIFLSVNSAEDLVRARTIAANAG